MNWITPIRLPRAQKIALAVLNTGHPGPMPRGLIYMSDHDEFTRSQRGFFTFCFEANSCAKNHRLMNGSPKRSLVQPQRRSKSPTSSQFVDDAGNTRFCQI